MFAVDFAQVGDNIQKQMDMKGFTGQGLADKLGISKQVMNKIIKGSKAINMHELAMVASVMGTTADTLLTISGEQLSADSLRFMEDVTDERLLHKINLIRMAIDEIHMLEELLELRELKPDDLGIRKESGNAFPSDENGTALSTEYAAVNGSAR